MKRAPLIAILVVVTALPALAEEIAQSGPAVADDPYLWLEDVAGERALAWVKTHNETSAKELEAAPDFAPIHDRLLAILDSDARIPYVAKHGRWFYNFWRDAAHVRGLWRRTSLAEYRRKQPRWETVLDLDALAAAENENWVWHGAECLYPDERRCLLSLSRGGGDAGVVREFDVVAKSFVSGGFALAEAKSETTWRDRDHLYVGTDFGPGSLTSSGYPRVLKLWKRGTPLAKAETVFEAQPDDVAAHAEVGDEPGYHHELIVRAITFYSSETWLRDHGKLVKLELPLDAEPRIWRDQLLAKLRSDWTVSGKTYPAGALIAIGLKRFLAGSRDFAPLFTPTPRTSLESYGATRRYLLLNTLDNVRGRIAVLGRKRGKWTREALEAPEFGSVSAGAVDRRTSDDYFLNLTDFLTPSSLYLGRIGKTGRELLKQLPAFFDTDGLEISQHEATSKDGTRVPYFQVARKDLALDGSNPTLLYGYGGFEVSMTPAYSAGIGSAWLEKGGVYVLANIRGGGEFGPGWHESAIKAHRQRAYDDFIAVAEDLVARKLTSTRHLGIQGGSNGGLLMGVMLTQRPDLFGAVVCQVPLLDMRRYHKLLAGASWMGEYGDPDKPAEWDWIRAYSPYQNLAADKPTPRTLFLTSTRDDRVHPGHARKMAAKMEAQGHDFLYYENTEGGHGGAANNRQQAYMGALAFTFLWQQLR